jgi:hypothetical protein
MLLALAPLASACFLVDENDTPQAVGQCVERAGARAAYPAPGDYGVRAKGVLVAQFPKGRAVLLFAGPGGHPTPPPGHQVSNAVNGRVAYWWEVPATRTEAGALTHCLTTAHS